MADSPIPIGETLANKYRVERVIGEGGMGVVVAAHHLELDQPVAIKFLLEGMADNAEGAERFRREARAAAKIHSDHVVRVLDVGVLGDGTRYMVMEYLDGKDLAEELAEIGGLPYGRACGIVLEALDAVGQAHAAGIVHRDLKPANLFLAQRPDGSQRVKVLDFGISKRVGATTADQLSLTKTSAWIGSPLYMAPEQMQSARDVDARADIWSMGAILYECIAGRPPYVAESLPQLCNLLITTDPTHLSERAPGIPQDLADAVMACLVRDPSGRIDNAGELARRIARHATTATGSGMRLSLGMLDVTEMQTGTGASWSTSTPSGAQPNSVLSTGNAAATGDGPSAPSASIASSGVGAVSAGSARAEASEFGATEHSQSGVSPLQPGASSITAGRTHAAWGGTGAAPTQTGRSGLRYGIVAAVVLLGGAVGYVVQRGQSAPEPEQVSELPMVAAPGIGSEVAAPDVLETGAGLVPAVDLVPAADLVPADPTAAKATDEQPPTGASSRPQESDPRSVDQPSQVVKPAVAPAPRPRSQVPRPVSAPRPAVSAPAPTPAPAPKSDDPFSGFGKRK